MSLEAIRFRLSAGRSDKKRNTATRHPRGVTCVSDLRYGPYGTDSLLNVYYPDGTDEPLPTIVSIHGGGYVYGDKEVYHHYCADLARRGFAVVSFNYRLAPRYHFPAPLEDTNKMMQWLCVRGRQYHLDPRRLFIVGDSAGAQLASQYAAIATNPEYQERFFKVPPIRILAVGLNCGMYDLAALALNARSGIHRDYLGKNAKLNDPRLDVLGAVTKNFPPAHITTAVHDFLRDNARPMYAFLVGKGVEAEYHCYGTQEQEHMGHVFHVDIRYPEAQECNDAQTAFFRRYL